MGSSELTPVLNRAEGLRRVRGNEKLYKALAGVFLNDLPRLTALLRDAVERQSAKDLHDAAHSLKGSASQLGAQAVLERAWTLEKMGASSELAGAAEQVARLDEDLRALSAALSAMSDERPA